MSSQILVTCPILDSMILARNFDAKGYTVYCTVKFSLSPCNVQYSTIHPLKSHRTTPKLPITTWKKEEDSVNFAKGKKVYLQSFDFDFKLKDVGGIQSGQRC